MFEPKFSISNKVNTQISEISEIKAVVARSKLLPEREVFLRRAAAIKMAHSSTSIEGNQLKEYQVAQLVEGKLVKAEEKEITEVKNYLKALREVDKMSFLKEKININSILKLHRLVLTGLSDNRKVGTFRPSSVYVVNILPNKEEQVVYRPPKAELVRGLIEELIAWINKNEQVHPIIRAAIFHYQFETIHPFTDGNGRTGRLLTLLYLYQSGWDFEKILVLEDFYNNNREAYYNALQTSSTYKKRQGVTLDGWIEYFVSGFLYEAKKVKDQVISLSLVKKMDSQKLTFDKDELQIIDFLVTLGQVTSSDVVDILDIPKRTAQSKLKKLEEQYIIKKSGAGPGSFYVLRNGK